MDNNNNFTTNNNKNNEKVNSKEELSFPFYVENYDVDDFAEVREFFKLIPKIHRSAVDWKVKKQFNGDNLAYIKKYKLFAQKFTREMRDLADETLKRRDEELRATKKKQKEVLLYASQLLGLVGKQGASYINESLLKNFKDDMEDQEAFLKTLRLIDRKGAIKGVTSLEAKQRRKVAQILNISATLDKIAKDRTEAGEPWTFLFVTLTLPPSYHPNPTRGANSFNGVMPLRAHNQLNQYWKLIRANLAKAGFRAGADYFGMKTLEAHKDSCLHIHSVIYMKVSDLEQFENIIEGVANRSTELVKFKLVRNNGKAGAATYVFKYITKTNADYKDENATKNSALRWYYSARGFDFFGIESAVSKFNFVIANKDSYADLFCDDLRLCLESHDYYTFITKYSKHFQTVRHNSKIDFVVYDLSGNDGVNFEKKAIEKALSQKVIIKKDIYCLFEIYDGFDEKTKNVRSLDKDDEKNSVVFNARDVARTKYDDYVMRLKAYKSANAGVDFVSKVENVVFYNVSDMQQEKEYCVFEDLEVFDEECQKIWADKKTVTLKPSYFKCRLVGRHKTVGLFQI